MLYLTNWIYSLPLSLWLFVAISKFYFGQETFSSLQSLHIPKPNQPNVSNFKNIKVSIITSTGQRRGTIFLFLKLQIQLNTHFLKWGAGHNKLIVEDCQVTFVYPIWWLTCQVKTMLKSSRVLLAFSLFHLHNHPPTSPPPPPKKEKENN